MNYKTEQETLLTFQEFLVDKYLGKLPRLTNISDGHDVTYKPHTCMVWSHILSTDSELKSRGPTQCTTGNSIVYISPVVHLKITLTALIADISELMIEKHQDSGLHV